MQERPDTVLILAAGQGIRLRPLTESVPKALVHCAGWPLISYAVAFARAALGGTGSLVVVAGYHGELLAEALADEAPDAKIVWNRDYHKGNLLSVVAGLPYVGRSLLVMNSDHIYPLSFAERFIAAPGAVVAAVDQDRLLGPDDMKVRLDGDGKIRKISKGLEEYDVGYIGMTLVRAEALDTYREAVKEAQRRLADAAVAEDVLQVLADWGFPVATCDLSGLGWLEIDTLEDLENAEVTLLEEEGFLEKVW